MGAERRVSVTAPRAAEAEIEIADNGCGMDREFVRDRLFRPFDRPRAARAWESARTRPASTCEPGRRRGSAEKPGRGHANLRSSAAGGGACATLPDEPSHNTLSRSRGAVRWRAEPPAADRRRRSGSAEAAQVVLRRVRSADRGGATARIAAAAPAEPPVVLQDLGLPPDPEGVGEGIATLKRSSSSRRTPRSSWSPASSTGRTRSAPSVSAPTTSTRNPSTPTCCG